MKYYFTKIMYVLHLKVIFFISSITIPTSYVNMYLFEKIEVGSRNKIL